MDVLVLKTGPRDRSFCVPRIHPQAGCVLCEEKLFYNR